MHCCRFDLSLCDGVGAAESKFDWRHLGRKAYVSCSPAACRAHWSISLRTFGTASQRRRIAGGPSRCKIRPQLSFEDTLKPAFALRSDHRTSPARSLCSPHAATCVISGVSLPQRIPSPTIPRADGTCPRGRTLLIPRPYPARECITSDPHGGSGVSTTWL